MTKTFERNDIVHTLPTKNLGYPKLFAAAKVEYFKKRKGDIEREIENTPGLNLGRGAAIKKIIKEKEEILENYIRAQPGFENVQLNIVEDIYAALTNLVLKNLENYLYHLSKDRDVEKNQAKLILDESLEKLGILKECITATQLSLNKKDPRSINIKDELDDKAEDILRLEWMIDVMSDQTGAKLKVTNFDPTREIGTEINLSGKNYKYSKSFTGFNSILIYENVNDPDDKIVIKRKILDLEYKALNNSIKSTFSTIMEFDYHRAFDKEHIVGHLMNGVSSVDVRDDKFVVSAYSVMPFYATDLGKVIKDNDLDSEKINKIFSQVIKGIKEIHSKGYLHRDIKPGNIFIKENGDAVIGDFGSCIKGAGEFQSNDGLTAKYFNERDLKIGSHIDHGYYDNKVEIYALGVMFLEMLGDDYMDHLDHGVITQLFNDKVNEGVIPRAFADRILRKVNVNPLDCDLIKRSLDDEVKRKVIPQSAADSILSGINVLHDNTIKPLLDLRVSEEVISQKVADCIFRMIDPDKLKRPDILEVEREFNYKDNVLLYVANLMSVLGENVVNSSRIKKLLNDSNIDIANIDRAEIKNSLNLKKIEINQELESQFDRRDQKSRKDFSYPDRYSGIGVDAEMIFDPQQNQWICTIKAVVKPSPAYQANLQIDDKIIVAGFTKDELSEVLKFIRNNGIDPEKPGNKKARIDGKELEHPIGTAIFEKNKLCDFDTGINKKTPSPNVAASGSGVSVAWFGGRAV